jgi:hypothetical protein
MKQLNGALNFSVSCGGGRVPRRNYGWAIEPKPNEKSDPAEQSREKLTIYIISSNI